MQYNKFFSRFYLYTMEVILLYVVLFLFYFHTAMIPPVLPFLVIVIGGGIIFTGVLSLMKTNTPYVFVMLFVPVLAFVGNKLGFTFGISLFLAGFICWRIVGHFQKDTKLSEFWLLFLTLGVGYLIYLGAIVQGYQYSDLILYFMIIQLLWMMISKVLDGFFSSSFIGGSSVVTKNSGSILGIFIGMIVGAVSLALVLPFIVKNLLSVLFSLTGKALYAASVPFFNAVENAEFKRKSPGDQGEGVGIGGLEDVTPLQEYFSFLSKVNIWMILSIIGLIIIAIILVIIARRKYVIEPEVVDAGSGYKYNMGTVTNTSTGSTRRAKFPAEKVRKLLLELELLAAKKGKGRLHSETLEEWLERNHFLHASFVKSYEKVRYGDGVLTVEEEQLCEQIVKQLKIELRRLKKSD
ncbi:hypothetical protein [Litchfieldia alkalitelluris]|uniref:hypothetical protein n=1 Tax=Litchfieldia alkalitelluris TaxID=304268 RepID=UPI0009966B5B|nr:hypothetical protein [Litchfieldia alkalitelluris]